MGTSWDLIIVIIADVDWLPANGFAEDICERPAPSDIFRRIWPYSRGK